MELTQNNLQAPVFRILGRVIDSSVTSMLVSRVHHFRRNRVESIFRARFNSDVDTCCSFFAALIT